MRARIYRPARNAMTSGMAKTRKWVLEYAPASAREVDPLMGWTSSALRSMYKTPKRANPICALAATAKTSPPTAVVRGHTKVVNRGKDPAKPGYALYIGHPLGAFSIC